MSSTDLVHHQSGETGGGGGGGRECLGKNNSSICPSKTTVYLSNIAYSLTNSDLFKLLEHCGKIVCTKIVKDKVTRKSKGYAFIQFLEAESAHKCVQEYNGNEMFGRKWSCSIAKDNGRAAEFIRKRTYADKSRCYECGEFGHLSYKCTKNVLGERDPPPKKKSKKRNKSLGSHSDETTTTSGTQNESRQADNSTDESDDSDKGDLETLSAAINFQRAKMEEEGYRESVASGNYEMLNNNPSDAAEDVSRKRRFVKDEYFSDEEVVLTDD